MSEGGATENGYQDDLVTLTRMLGESRRLAQLRGRPETTGDLLEAVLRHGSGRARDDLVFRCGLTSDAVAEINDRARLEGRTPEPARREVMQVLSRIHEFRGEVDEDAIVYAIVAVPESLGNQIISRTGLRIDVVNPVHHRPVRGEPMVEVELPDRMGWAATMPDAPTGPRTPTAAELELQYARVQPPLSLTLEVSSAVMAETLPEVVEVWMMQQRAGGDVRVDHRLIIANDGSIELSVGRVGPDGAFISHTRAVIRPEGDRVAVDIVQGDARAVAMMTELGRRIAAIRDSQVAGPGGFDIAL